MGFSLHLLTNTRITAKQHWLSLSLSLFLQTIDQQLPLQGVCFSLVSYKRDWKISDKMHAPDENIVKAQVVVCFASVLCIFVLTPVDYPPSHTWRWAHAWFARFPEETQQVCVANQKRRKCNAIILVYMFVYVLLETARRLLTQSW